MKKVLYILIGIVIGMLSVGVVRASTTYYRLQNVDCSEEIDNRQKLCLVWDEVEKTNCYMVVNTNPWSQHAAGGVSCIKKGSND